MIGGFEKPTELSTERQFMLDHMSRTIDKTEDVMELRDMAKGLLSQSLWLRQFISVMMEHDRRDGEDL